MKALYAGTFDPLTYGHIDIINRAKKVFDEVIVGIAINARKKPIFTIEKRMEFVGNCAEPIEVVTYEGLTVDFCRNRGIQVLLRGVRSQLDFEYEYPIACANRELNRAVETVLIMADPSLSYVSSSMVKEIIYARGDIRKFVPLEVAEALEEKLLYE